MDDLLPGLHHAPNVHPLFLHFPLVLWPTSLAFAVVAAFRARDDLLRVARWLLHLGTLSSFVAAATGYQAMLEMEGMPGHDLIHVHMTWMFTTIGLGVATSVLAWVLAKHRPSPRTSAALAGALLVTCTVMALGADRGAHLVFRFGIGTQQETPPEGTGGHHGHEHHGR
jgi:uncharacterized membrane protein